MQRVGLEHELHALEGEHAAILLDHGVLGFGEDAHKIVLGKGLGLRDDRRTANELGDHAEVVEILGQNLLEQDVLVLGRGAGDLGVEADALVANAIGDDLVQAHERAAADEQDVGGVDLQELLLRVLAPASGRNTGDGALEDLEQSLLHTLAGDIARDGEVLGLAGDLVDLIHVDDTDLRAVDIAVCRGDELEQDVLNVLAHITGLGEGRGVGDGERDLEYAGQRLREQRLAGARGPEQQDVALGKLDILVDGMGAQGILDGIAHQNATIMVVHSHGHGALGVLLAHDILGQRVVDLVRGGHAGDDALGGLAHGGGRRLILVHIEIVHRLGVIHVRAKGTHHLVLSE